MVNGVGLPVNEDKQTNRVNVEIDNQQVITRVLGLY
jgi:hypothetical protein